MQYCDEHEHKSPRAPRESKKRESWTETGDQTGKDGERDNHRHVHVRC